ncbi:hypothetical protein [Spiroplasma poulsonii]|uniref:hypothetical protein n=1 Tax=Spiroplasma poulsonii TaxID=2138 RepID=UPI001F4C691D|nr:hypothetical protein [Spiroplasma poulsonii]UNF61752.1 hypothetical protein MNU24_07530 [Spiroplasma poulsonii]
MQKLILVKVYKLDKPTIHVADPTKTTPEQLKPQFKDVVLKAVKAVNSSLTESDFDYFIEKWEWIDQLILQMIKLFEVQIEGKKQC